MSIRRKLVVAGLIIGAESDRVLITRRRADQALGGWWELPGGKVEPGESPTEALSRELAEEIGVAVQVGRIWDVLHHRYPEFEVVMLVYPCRIRDGQTPRALEVAEMAWCTPDELPGYEILPADAPLVERLRAEGIPAWPEKTRVV